MHTRAFFVVSLVAALLGGCKHDSGSSDAPDLAGPTSCEPNPCTDAHRTTCVVDPAGVRCVCDPGTHETEAGCVPDTTCLPSTCNGHGTCSAESGTLTCLCDTEHTGEWCHDCRAGLYSDGSGGCTDDPCLALHCASLQRCTVTGGVAACACEPGNHDDHGSCVPDQTCMPTTCDSHGTCHDDAGVIACDCMNGYAGSFCGSCAVGWHADGAGGCTDDPCRPNACTDPHKTVCTASGSSAVCACDPGYHAAGSGCAVDETCAPTSCAGHGTCSVVGGVRSCACAVPYTGATCADCASGAHPDGAGGCTTDACLPNPCTGPHKTVCTALGVTAQCACEVGYHADGIGGCTNDPCTPNLCAASNQACRVNNGAAECYTPTCSDNNPCTTDTLVGGTCQHTPLGNGTTCSTNLCLLGQTCNAGACQGGSTRTCDDSNPCTKDSCDPVSGCKAANDDTLVPDDGFDCTVDHCSAGSASHTPSHASCDDGKWCTGNETCAPGAGADAHGCVHSAVPVAPPLTPNECAAYHCDEATHTFAITKQPVGTPCDDHVPCSTGDACRADGACRGTAISSCPQAGCTTLTALGSGIDLRYGNLSGAVKLNGAALPTSSADSGTIVLSLVAKDTGAAHTIDLVTFNYTGSGYVLASGATYATRLLPGVYDLLYERNYYSNGDYSAVTHSTDAYANGRRYLQRDVVIGTGYNVLDIDLSSASLSGAVKLNGAALPTSSADSATIALSLVAKDTGAEHTIDLVTFNYTGSGYVLASGATYNTKIPAGTYDLLYERNYYNNGNYSSVTHATDGYANGRRYLKKDVVISAGANVLDIDLSSASLAGAVKLNGAALPTSSADSATIALSLVAKDTGAEHTIDLVTFNYTGSGYVLAAGATYNTKIPSGTYDLLYERNYYNNGNYSSVTHATDAYANGRRYLQRDVVVAAGANVLDIDLSSASLSGAVKLNGAALPTGSADSATIALSLVAKDTGAEHTIDLVTFNYTGSGYVLAAGAMYNTKIPAGTYDLLYERNYYNNGDYSSVTSASDGYANGRRYLKKDVVIAAGANVLDIDLSSASLSGAVRLNGAALPASSADSGTIALSLVAKDTGAEHTIDLVTFNYTGSGYVLASGATYNTKIPAGTYDLLYERNYYNNGNYSSVTSASDGFANGRRYLQRDVVVSPGSNTLDINLSAVATTGVVTLAGGTLPTSSADSATIGFSLVAKDTGAEHTIDLVTFNYTGSGYVLASGATYNTKIPAGTYDLLYERNYYNNGNYASATSASDNYANGRRYVGMCVTVP